MFHKKIATICNLFIHKGKNNLCDNRLQQYSADLPQGGLEIPCQLVFSGNHKVIKLGNLQFTAKAKVADKK